MQIKPHVLHRIMDDYEMNFKPSIKIGPGEYTHMSLHKQMAQSRYTGRMLKNLYKTRR